MFFGTRAPTNEDLKQSEHLVLTSASRYDPAHLVAKHKIKLKKHDLLKRRRGKSTIKTVDLINETVDSGKTIPSKIFSDETEKFEWDKSRLHEWGSRLCSSYETTRRTFFNTTQLCQGLACENSRDPKEKHKPRFVTGRRLGERVWSDTLEFKLSRFDESGDLTNPKFQFFVCQVLGYAQAIYLGNYPKTHDRLKLRVSELLKIFVGPLGYHVNWEQITQMTK